MATAHAIAEELAETGASARARCAHPRSMQGVSEGEGTELRYVCDPDRGGCGEDLGPVGARR